MAVAVVQEWAASTGRGTTGYDAVANEVRERTGGEPEGLIVHSAGYDGDTFRGFSIWESLEHYERFRDEVLMPSVAASGPAAGSPPEIRTYELHALVAPSRAHAS